MKTRFLGTILVVAMALVGCGGTPADADGTMHPGDVTANTSALYSYVPYNKVEGFSPYVQCDGVGFRMSLGSLMTVTPQSWGGIYAADTYAVYFSKDTRHVLSLSSGAIALHTSMDGSYHTLTNDVASTTADMQEYDEASPTTADGLWYAHPVEIPQYGIVIYAAGERSDYPNGFARITIDPNTNVEAPPVPEASHGRCSYRQVFTVSL